MCGFVAAIGPEPAPLAEVERRAARLAHRGPDGSGLHACGGAVLAHRRLAIVDVAGGAQPLVSDVVGHALACNGEIYNHAELRSRLASRQPFRTRSDSEVILRAWPESGRRVPALLDGMFAFVVTDGERFLAARDPLGIKPLYLGRDADGRLWLASELAALADACEVIEEFPAGTLLTDEGGLERYFEPGWRTFPEQPLEYDAGALLERLEAAVVKRLMSEVPLGVFLSGGLDSSLIAALVRRHVDELHSFAVGLPGSPDLAAARRMAAHLGTIHHEHVYSDEAAVAALPEVIRHLESYDPPLVRSAVPCYFVSRLAAEHVKVVLSGEGSDEAFAGYRYFRGAADARALHAECVRLLQGLHNMNLQRVDRMTMAHGLEGRVPFLDLEFLELAMRLDPEAKRHRPGRPEKYLLRRAAKGLLPEELLWRTKQEFAQGCGSEWTLAEWAEREVSDAELAQAAEVWAGDPPRTKEELAYRRLFERYVPARARAAVGRWRGAFAGEEEVRHA